MYLGTILYNRKYLCRDRIFYGIKNSMPSLFVVWTPNVEYPVGHWSPVPSLKTNGKTTSFAGDILVESLGFSQINGCSVAQLASFHFKLSNISTHFSPPFESFGSPRSQFSRFSGEPSDQTNPFVNVASWLRPIHHLLPKLATTCDK